MCVIKPAKTICWRPNVFSVASRSVWAKALGSGLCTTGSPLAGRTVSTMGPPRASRSNSPPGRPRCCTCTTGAAAARARPRSRARAARAGSAPGRASLPSRYSFCASMMTSVEVASEGGRRSAPDSSNRVLAAVMATPRAIPTLSGRPGIGPTWSCGVPADASGRWAHGPPTSLPAPFGPEPGRTAGLGQLAHAQNVALALGDGDDAARIQQVEDVACLDTLVIGRQRQPMSPVVGTRSGIAGCQQRLALLFGIAEVLQQDVGIGVLKIEARVFLFGLQEHIAVGQLALIVAAVEVEVKYAIDA